MVAVKAVEISESDKPTLTIMVVDDEGSEHTLVFFDPLSILDLQNHLYDSIYKFVKIKEKRDEAERIRR